MNKYLYIVLGLILMLSFGCSGNKSSDTEAAAIKAIQPYIVKCGGLIYTKGTVVGGSKPFFWREKDIVYIAHKGGMTIAEANETAEADKLNGYQFRGKYQFCLKGPFKIYKNGNWSEWREGEVNGFELFCPTVNVTKKGTNIQAQVIEDNENPWFYQLSCDEIPK